MKKISKLNKVIYIFSILLILASTTISNATILKATSNESSNFVFLGSVSIVGHGKSSTLNFVPENKDRISACEKTFVVNYTIDRMGENDEAAITLLVAINGDYLPTVSISTDSNKIGKLEIKDVSINPGDKYTYTIGLSYVSSNPYYLNETSISGGGDFVRAKTKTICNTSTNLIMRLLEAHPYILRILRYTIGL